MPADRLAAHHVVGRLMPTSAGRGQALPLRVKVNPRTTALLVIDVQNDYASPDGWLGRAGADMQPAVTMLPRLEHLLTAARQAGVTVIFTRNWHRPETDSDAWLDKLAREGSTQDDRPGRADTTGAQFFGVGPLPGEQVISKFRYDAFLGTNLEYILRAKGIRTVLCTGTATHVCVESTARAAHMRDYHVVLVGDCCASSDPADHAATLRNVERYFGQVADADAVIAVWTAA